MRGCFITLEGGEGAGKSTLVKALESWLAERGRDVVVTREPGGTPGAELLRDILLTGATDRWSPVTEALLMYAARVDHVERLIQPALERGAFVICDRFADSTLAYQGTAGGVPAERIRQIHAASLGDFHPDLTLVLDIDPRIGMQRTLDRGESATRFERLGLDFHNRLRRAFLDIAAADTERCVVIDAGQSPENVTGSAISALESRLGQIA